MRVIYLMILLSLQIEVIELGQPGKTADTIDAKITSCKILPEQFLHQAVAFQHQPGRRGLRLVVG